jgi:hypothetical protein
VDFNELLVLKNNKSWFMKQKLHGGGTSTKVYFWSHNRINKESQIQLDDVLNGGCSK